MSALARFFNIRGIQVSGYDKTCTPLTKSLEKEGIKVHYEENIAEIPINADLVIYTPAIPNDSIELQYILNKKTLLKKRSEVLGEISEGMFLIAVAGTHGKTTITGMISHILNNSGISINAFIGGIVKNFSSNLITSPEAKILVAEADEYDKSFLKLNPDIAIVTAMDADHLDIYNTTENLQNTFGDFMQRVSKNGSLILKSGLKQAQDVSSRIYRYSISRQADFFVENIEVINGRYSFTANVCGERLPIILQIAGRHNVENALAATAACFLQGVSLDQIKSGLESYEGIERRFDYRIRTENLVYIDDYAHHPEELKATIFSARELYPDKKITGIFQPHLYTRTLHFADEFASELDKLDEIILLDIYPARELPIPGVTSEMILQKMKNKNCKVVSKESLLDELNKLKLEILLTMGAGDIDQFVIPITNRLTEKTLNQ